MGVLPITPTLIATVRRQHLGSQLLGRRISAIRDLPRPREDDADPPDRAGANYQHGRQASRCL